MKKMRNEFKLHYERLASEDPILEQTRQLRRKRTLKEKQDAHNFVYRMLALPPVMRKFVAKLRRVKR